MKAKCQYVIDQGLGGVMIWSLDQDVADNRSLLSAIHETLSAPTTRTPAKKKE
jgi:GH18 family chitinase